MHQQTPGFLVKRFRLLEIIGFSFICSLICPVKMLAAPQANWDGQWHVVLGLKRETGNASDIRAFGLASTQDGQIDFGVPGQALAKNPAVAKSKSGVSPGPKTTSERSSASTSVEFSRSFTLNGGGPKGWNIGLQGIIRGNLSAVELPVTPPIDRPLTPNAFVFADASVAGAHTVLLQKRIDPGVFQSDPTFLPINMPFAFLVGSPVFGPRLFQDGTYNFSGSFQTGASIRNSHRSPNSSALADFFNSFSVGVNAIPLSEPPPPPVPENINLVGVLAIVGFCGFIWFRRSRALRCS